MPVFRRLGACRRHEVEPVRKGKNPALLGFIFIYYLYGFEKVQGINLDMGKKGNL
jgi:hypothetical protein